MRMPLEYVPGEGQWRGWAVPSNGGVLYPPQNSVPADKHSLHHTSITAIHSPVLFSSMSKMKGRSQPRELSMTDFPKNTYFKKLLLGYGLFMTSLCAKIGFHMFLRLWKKQRLCTIDHMFLKQDIY